MIITAQAKRSGVNPAAFCSRRRILNLRFDLRFFVSHDTLGLHAEAVDA